MAERQIRLITKRTSVPGKVPSGTTGNELNLIRSGELASNLADKKLFGFDGVEIFEYGSNTFLNLTGGTISGNLFVSDNFSANTLFSGSTDLYEIFSTIGSSGTGQTTLVQPGSNIITGGTNTSPIISVSSSPSFDGLTLSGFGQFSTISATSISATTFYGNGSNITGLTGGLGVTVNNPSTPGVKGFVTLPYNATIVGWDIIGNTTGNCAFDIWRGTSYSIPNDTNTITGSEKPILSNQQINYDNNLTTWQTYLSANDTIAFYLISAETLSSINLLIKVIKN